MLFKYLLYTHTQYTWCIYTFLQEHYNYAINNMQYKAINILLNTIILGPPE